MLKKTCTATYPQLLQLLPPNAPLHSASTPCLLRVYSVSYLSVEPARDVNK